MVDPWPFSRRVNHLNGRSSDSLRFLAFPFNEQWRETKTDMELTAAGTVSELHRIPILSLAGTIRLDKGRTFIQSLCNAKRPANCFLVRKDIKVFTRSFLILNFKVL